MPVEVGQANTDICKVGPDPLRTKHYRVIVKEIFGYRASFAPATPDIGTNGNDPHDGFGSSDAQGLGEGLGGFFGQTLQNCLRQTSQQLLIFDLGQRGFDLSQRDQDRFPVCSRLGKHHITHCSALADLLTVAIIATVGPIYMESLTGYPRPGYLINLSGWYAISGLHTANLQLRHQHKPKPGAGQAKESGEKQQRSVIHGLASAALKRSVVTFS